MSKGIYGRRSRGRLRACNGCRDSARIRDWRGIIARQRLHGGPFRGAVGVGFLGILFALVDKALVILVGHGVTILRLSLLGTTAGSIGPSQATRKRHEGETGETRSMSIIALSEPLGTR